MYITRDYLEKKLCSLLEIFRAALKLKQKNIQFKNEGTDLGIEGAVTNINFVGNAVDTSLTGNTLSVNVNGVQGTGTTNRVVKFINSTTIGDSQIFDDGTNVGVNTVNPSDKLHVAGTLRVDGNTTIWGNSNLNVTHNQGIFLNNFSDSGRQVNIKVTGDETTNAINRFLEFSSNSSAYGFKFSNANGDLVRLFSNGNFGINQTSDNGLGRLQVNGDIWGSANIFYYGSLQLRNNSGSGLLIGGGADDDKRMFFTPRNAEGNGWDWSSEFGYNNNTVRGWYFKTQLVIGNGSINPTASAELEVASTTRGFLPPRMTAANRTAISSPAIGLMVYQTDGGSEEGIWTFKSTGWVQGV